MESSKNELRTVFISDLHLGSLACNADLLLAFLRRVSCATLVVIGDVVDYECRRTMRYWTSECDHVLAELAAISRAGVQVLYVPGNHDDFARGFAGERVLGAEIHQTRVYELLDGHRALLVHGDEHDFLTGLYKGPLTELVAHLYERLCRLSRLTSDALRFLGCQPIAFSNWIKRRSKTYLRSLDGFEAALVAEAKRLKCDAVFCGHVHVPDIKTLDGIVYANSGDWIENCSAIVESYDGTLRLLRVARA